jgi:hypothetical protein
MKKKFLQLLMVIGVLLITNTSKAQQLLLPTEADVWGEPQKINLTTGGTIQLRTKFIKHYGTTCVFEIEFTNLSTKAIKETCQLISNNSSGMYTHWATDLRLAVGEVAVYQMERRACKMNLKKSKQKNITKCADCAPAIFFLKK